MTKGITAGRAEVTANDVGAEPVAARFAIWVDALHSGAGHVLHVRLLLIPVKLESARQEPNVRGLIAARDGKNSFAPTLWEAVS